MKRLKVLIIILFSFSLMSFNDEAKTHEEITVYIPRELFFIGLQGESAALAFFEEFGGIVGILDEDVQTFWRNESANAGTVNIEITFSRSNLIAIAAVMRNELEMFLEAIADNFGSTFEREASGQYTRFVLGVAFYEFFYERPALFFELADFVFPEMGMIEYLYRIFHQYNMADLKEITFYAEDPETSKRIEIYSFLHSAPVGLGIRHGVEH